MDRLFPGAYCLQPGSSSRKKGQFIGWGFGSQPVMPSQFFTFFRGIDQLCCPQSLGKPFIAHYIPPDNTYSFQDNVKRLQETIPRCKKNGSMGSRRLQTIGLAESRKEFSPQEGDGNGTQTTEDGGTDHTEKASGHTTFKFAQFVGGADKKTRYR